MHLPSMRQRSGFTLIELLVVIAIIAILAGMLFPVFAKAREQARRANCISNQRQAVMAIQMYANDHERYPGAMWASECDLRGEVTQCPSQPDLEQGIGINSFLTRTRPDTVSRPSLVVCTTDATGAVTSAGLYGRHGKDGAVFGRLDGSVVWSNEPSKAGQFAVGKFPIRPMEDLGSGAVLVKPQNFTDCGAGTATISTSFLIVGPYGDGDGDGTQVDVPPAGIDNLVGLKYIDETSLAEANADASPRLGDRAPKEMEINDPITGDTPDTAGKPINLFKKWTKVSGDSGTWSLKSEENYNCMFKKRTTYAVTYVYSPTAQSGTLVFNVDDGGTVWMNGNRIVSTALQESGGSLISVPAFVLPEGVSYFLVKDTNGTDGGMKFKLMLEGYTNLAVSPVLE